VFEVLERTVFVATSYSRGTPFLHVWGSNCNPLRLAVGKSAGRDAKLSLYSTDGMVPGGSLEFESRMQFRNAVPIRKLIQFVARGRNQDCSAGSAARLPLAKSSRYICWMMACSLRVTIICLVIIIIFAVAFVVLFIFFLVWLLSQSGIGSYRPI
jgi:type IV secretory pathway VirB6-like protein